ncbi:MAG: phosphatase PAP2 family protein [Candidatus Gracilibacteria bacterium]|nr:phosphatase PAP2 family protein [Candidatus Gracilibacteria bacterium]
MLEKIISADIGLLKFIQSFVDPDNGIQVEIIKLLSDFGVILVVILLIGLWIYGVYKKKDIFKENALMIFYSIAFSFLIYVILNLGLPLRPRPETVSAIRPLVDHLPDNSFPSGHAIFAGASIFASYFFSKRCVFSVLVIFSFLMLISRIMVGIHYPTDIFVGLIIGMIGAFFVYKNKDSGIFKKYLLPFPIKIAKFIKL